VVLKFGFAINTKMKTFVQYYPKNVHTRKTANNSVVLKNYSLTYFPIMPSAGL